MRNAELERNLCYALQRHRIVELRYKHQLYSRTFEPYIIYHSSQDNVLVWGIQTANSSKPFQETEPHNFEVADITSLAITEKCFKYDNRFDPSSKMYSNGIVCVIKPLKVSDETS